MPENKPADRWQHYFAGRVPIEPWIGPRPGGYALLLGQVPTDTAVIGVKEKYRTNMHGVYR